MKSQYLSFGLALVVSLFGVVVVRGSSGVTYGREIEVANSTKDERLLAVAYNSNRNEELVVWQVDTGGGDTDVFGRRARLSPAFHWIGDAFAIVNTSSPERAARVVFNPLDDDYLVVYERQLPSGDVDVLGQRVAGWSGGGDNTPELRGTMFNISVSVGKEEQPDVAFLPSTQQFLVVYALDGDIRARRVARYHQGPGGAETIGGNFIIAADLQRREMEPTVAASTQQSYFLVAYAYEFNSGDFDIYGQRVRGLSSPGNELLDEAFDIAFASGSSETAPRLAYGQYQAAFLAVWTATVAGNSDVQGKWLDERRLSGDPALGSVFDVSAQFVAAESSPWADVDSVTGDAAVVLAYEPTPGMPARLGIVWLATDPLASNAIARPLYLFPERSFPFAAPRLCVCPNQPGLLVGYSARFGSPPTYEYDAHLLVASRWAVMLPVILRP